MKISFRRFCLVSFLLFFVCTQQAFSNPVFSGEGFPSATVSTEKLSTIASNPSARVDIMGFGVPYSLHGILRIDGKIITLNSPDGRLFYLVMDPNYAKKFNGTSVKIDGLAKQADDLVRIIVKKIANFDPSKEVIPPNPYKEHQMAGQLISKKGGKYVMRIRWAYEPPPEGSSEWPKPVFDNVTIDPKLVEEVYFVKKPFPPEWIAAHSLFVFKVKEGGVVNSKGEKAGGIALSIEAYQRTDQNFDLFKGLQNQFGISWILATWKNYLEDSCRFTDYKLIKYPLVLTQDQKVSLFEQSLEQAAVDRQGEYYHTITNNCTNNLIVLLNRVLDPQKRIRMWWVPSITYNFRATCPTMVPDMLKKKGYLKDPLPEINKTNYTNEFEDYEK
ncbi:MAG: DUF4105 domain-containing protein [Candidatus Riflebacteria bacterium]|nr:DUF4105 domain-containing protein [Candidatus Riflebacteria bacterium]